jgi:hypothetical protein
VEPAFAARSRRSPISPEATVEQGRDAYLHENGFTLEAYEAAWTPASFLGLRFAVPNTSRHRWAIRLHDLHHVATGYGTDPAGEAEISAWELRRGIRSLGLYVGTIVLGLALLGLVIAPRRTLRAWRASGPAGRTLFNQRDEVAYESLLRRPVGELRTLLGVPRLGLAECPGGLHSRAPQHSPTGQAC